MMWLYACTGVAAVATPVGAVNLIVDPQDPVAMVLAMLGLLATIAIIPERRK